MSAEQIVVAYPFISATIPDAAKATGVSETTLREAIDAGDLTACFIGAKATKPVVRAVELDAWLRTRPAVRGRRATA